MVTMASEEPGSEAHNPSESQPPWSNSGWNPVKQYVHRIMNSCKSLFTNTVEALVVRKDSRGSINAESGIFDEFQETWTEVWALRESLLCMCVHSAEFPVQLMPLRTWVQPRGQFPWLKVYTLMFYSVLLSKQWSYISWFTIVKGILSLCRNNVCTI